jgi:hypothetical protein
VTRVTRGTGRRAAIGWTWRAGLGLLLAVVTAGTAAAQVPLFVGLDNAQNPPGLNWYRIQTPHFRVIFPDSMAAEAQRTANLLEAVYAPLLKTMPQRPEPIAVILNNQSAISNAFVAWAPRRSEWYALPPATIDEMGAIDWFSLLAVHEGRHVVQERSVRQGVVGVLGKVFGQATTAFVGGGLYFPPWFWEGDAVGTETALTNAGRGRQPSFANRIRTMRLNGEPYNYYQAWHGSYRTYYPDWYQLGYILTTHVKRKYGEDAWSKVIRATSRSILPPYAISRGLKKVTGRSLTQVHRDAVAELDSLWREQLRGFQETPATILSPVNSDYHAWRLPQYASDGSVIAEYSDLSHVTSLVRVRGGRTETLVRHFATRGDQSFHVVGDRVVWTEYQVDPRFVQRSYLVVKLLDLKSGRIRQLTHKGRHFGAALSPDGRRVAAVRFSESSHATIEVRDAESGRLLQSLDNPEDHFLVTPSWSGDGRSLLLVALDRRSARGNALVRVDLATQRADTLLPWRELVISRPVELGRWVLYGSPSSGLDNIEALDTRTGRRFQVTSRRYGARNASVAPDGKRLAFQDYGADGFDIAAMTVDTSMWTPVEQVTPRRLEYFTPLIAQEQGRSALEQIRPTVWRADRFRASTGEFAIHSLSFAATGDESNKGFALQARNALNTMAASAAFLFNTRERTSSVDAGVSYGAWYPIIDVAGRVGQRASNATLTTGERVDYHWNERSAQIGARVPLVRLSGLSTQSLSVGAAVGWTRISDLPVTIIGENNNGDFTPVSYALAASHFLPSAARDIAPRGLFGIASYRHTPFAGDYDGRLLSVRGAVFLPGLIRHHGLRLDAVREEQRPTNYLFSTEYSGSRGYHTFTHERFMRASATYMLPLFYPDLAVGPLAYFKRVQGAAFFDWGAGERRDGTHRFLYRSVGGEITTDMSPIQLRDTFRAGVRLSYRLDEAPAWRTDFVFALPF